MIYNTQNLGYGNNRKVNALLTGLSENMDELENQTRRSVGGNNLLRYYKQNKTKLTPNTTQQATANTASDINKVSEQSNLLSEAGDAVDNVGGLFGDDFSLTNALGGFAGRNPIANGLNKLTGNVINPNYLSGDPMKMIGQGLSDLGFESIGSDVAGLNMGSLFSKVSDPLLSGLSGLTGTSGAAAAGTSAAGAGASSTAAATEGILSKIGSWLASLL